MKISIFLLRLASYLHAANTDDSISCSIPLIQTKQPKLRASQSHNSITGPEYGQLNRTDGGGGWCHPGISPNSKTNYFETEFDQLIKIVEIGFQGRHGGVEGIQTAALNVSIDGINWATITKIGGSDSSDTDIEVRHNLDIHAYAKFFRIIPIVKDLEMPVCFRIEFYGCSKPSLEYFKNYKLSPLPVSSSNRKMNKMVEQRGLGQLTDEDIFDFLRFENQKLEISLFWTIPVNVTEIELYVLDTSESCLSEIEVSTNQIADSKKFKIGCRYQSGRRKIPISINVQTDQIVLSLTFEAELYVSEVKWSFGELEPIIEKDILLMTTVKSDWFSVVAGIFGVTILVLTVILVSSFARGQRSRSEMKGHLRIQSRNTNQDVLFYPADIGIESDDKNGEFLRTGRAQGSSDLFETDSGRGESIYAHLH